MVAPVNAKVGSGEFVGRNLDFYTVTTSVNITPGAVGSASQIALDTLNQTIALNGQTVLFQLEGAGVVKFAIEHTLSWGVDAAASEAALLAALVATGLFTAENTEVVYAAAL